MAQNHLADNYFSLATREEEGSVLAEATESATESADTAIMGPTFFLFFTAVALIAFSIYRFLTRTQIEQIRTRI